MPSHINTCYKTVWLFCFDFKTFFTGDNEEPDMSAPLENLSSPSSDVLTSPNRLEEYSSPILEVLELSPFKSPDYQFLASTQHFHT